MVISPRLSVAALLSFIFAIYCFQLIAGLSTIPHVENGGTVILARRENETNVTVFCRVTNNGSEFETSWFLTRLNEMEIVITFGGNLLAVPNFIAVGATSNLTIENFSRDLDKAVLRCTNVAIPEHLENVMFLLRIIG